MMDVELVNDGPVTIVIDSEPLGQNAAEKGWIDLKEIRNDNDKMSEHFNI
jgi:hypothetical protein